MPISLGASNAPVTVGEVLYLASDNGSLYCIDTAEGIKKRVIWENFGAGLVEASVGLVF